MHISDPAVSMAETAGRAGNLSLLSPAPCVSLHIASLSLLTAWQSQSSGLSVVLLQRTEAGLMLIAWALTALVSTVLPSCIVHARHNNALHSIVCHIKTLEITAI